MRVKKFYVMIAIFGVLLALGIGGFLAFQYVASNGAVHVPGFSKSDVVPTDIPLQDIPLPETQQVIMNVPGPDASESAYQQYRANIEFNAKASDKVVITDCVPDPMVLKVVSGKTFKVENRDIKKHTITVNPSHVYILNPKATLEIKADFGNGLGIYTYTCDAAGLPAGVFLVRDSL